MIEKKIIVEDVDDKDILENTKEVIQNNHFKLLGITIVGIELERLGGYKGIESEEVTIWLKADEDIYDTEYPISNEFTVKIPMDREVGLDEVSDLLIKEMYNYQDKVIKSSINL